MLSSKYFIKFPYIIPRGYTLEFLHSIDMHCVTCTMLDVRVTKMNRTMKKGLMWVCQVVLSE